MTKELTFNNTAEGYEALYQNPGPHVVQLEREDVGEIDVLTYIEGMNPVKVYDTVVDVSANQIIEINLQKDLMIKIVSEKPVTRAMILSE